ncbi:MAG TPA: PAS domain-containing sensor histidine kinase [Streptosporangiaceae bacterium]|nr:PAS domain-containing sensor histidine kinase [Streptosporangiaceae bacterium]
MRHAADHQAEDLVRLLAKIAPVGIVQTDAGGQCVFVNDRWCALTGTTVPQALGAGWSDALHPDDVERVTEEWLRAAEHRGELRTDCRLRPADGGEIWVHVAAMPLPGADGQPFGYLAAITNISDRKRAEAERERLLAAEQRTRTAEIAARELAEVAQERLVEQNTRLLELDEIRRQFLAAASHELSTPIASIISFCELIREGDTELSAHCAESLGVIERNARRLLRLVGDLLLVTRIEAGGLPLDIGSVSVPELIADVARSNAPEAAKQGVRVEVSAEDGPPLLADQERLHQVLDNLVSNAIKFTARNPSGKRERQGLVRITAAHEDRAWRVEVADSGIGIPPGELGQVFDRFARASNAKAASLPGTGLGLSVVKAVTELHGGRVAVDSAEGIGTTFRVYLPAAR